MYVKGLALIIFNLFDIWLFTLGAVLSFFMIPFLSKIHSYLIDVNSNYPVLVTNVMIISNFHLSYSFRMAFDVNFYVFR